MGSTGDLSLKWNPKNLEIKTRTVERTLEPLVMQVCFCVNLEPLPCWPAGQQLAKDLCLSYVDAGNPGDDPGLVKVAAEEEGKVEEGSCAGGCCGAGHCYLR